MTNEQLVIGHDFNNGGGRYWIDLDYGSAELTYRNRGDGVIVIDHTFVPPEARGGNIAQKLVERAASDARKAGLKIDPQCPYVDLLFRRRSQLNELRAG